MTHAAIRLFVLSTFFWLGACATAPVQTALIDPQGASGTAQNLFIITNRTPSQIPAERFDRGRSDYLTFGRAAVWVPKNRTPGTVTFSPDKPDPDKDFLVTDYGTYAHRDAFIHDINRTLQGLPAEAPKTIFIFIHGYNVGFGDGLFRNAQITHDFKAGGVNVYFSWPSSARLSQYLYDKDSAHITRDKLAETLKLLSETDAENITILAHSMGTLLTMEALRDLSLTGETAVLEKISPLALASPDIDQAVFEAQLAALKPRPEPIVVFVSDSDRALQLSSRLSGGSSRVGIGRDKDRLRALGLYVVDLSPIKDSGDSIGHIDFAASPTVLKLINSGKLRDATLENADGQQNSGHTATELSDIATSIILMPFRLIRNEPLTSRTR